MNSSISPLELKRRYKILIKRYHPDAHPDISEKEKAKYEEFTKRINEAYRILLDDNGKYYSYYYNSSYKDNINNEETSYTPPPPNYKYKKNRKFFNFNKLITFKNTVIALIVLGILELVFSSTLIFFIKVGLLMYIFIYLMDKLKN